VLRGLRGGGTNHLDAGLVDYDRLRTRTTASVQQRVPEILDQAAVYESQPMTAFYSREVGANEREVSLILEDVECAACAWLIERTLATQPGVVEAAVNFSTHRARVRWDAQRCTLGTLLAAVARIGYRAQPYDPARREAALQREARTRLRRLAVAGLFGMQVMMVAVVLYAGQWWGIDPAFYTMFRWFSLALCLPILIYSASPFFTAASRGMLRGSPGMDLPVSLDLSIAFAASAYATVLGEGHVYFDSVAMFTFFLLLARHVEFLARQRAQQTTEALVSPAPAFARRIEPDNKVDSNATHHSGQRLGLVQASENADANNRDEIALVPVAELYPGDRVRALPGESVPADGIITCGAANVDESLLSGEARPVQRRIGDEVHAGTLNCGSALEVRVSRVGADMVISRVLALVEQAAETRPRLALLAEKVARVFVLAVVAIATVVGVYWWNVDADKWLTATIAVLVVTCPCALSLATPAAMTAAASALTRHGLVPARGLNIEALAAIEHVVFDKTGTLTTGQFSVLGTHPLGQENTTTLLRAAAALERYSEHPIARAIEAVSSGPGPTASDVHTHQGLGISGRLGDQRWWLGVPAWVCEQAQLPHLELHRNEHTGSSMVMIAANETACALIELVDELRAGAVDVVNALKSQGIGVSMYSGDGDEAVQRIADRLGIIDYAANLLPQDKLNRLRALTASGLSTAMVGDGINDAPVLASASVSVAMGTGAHTARANAGFILINEQLGALLEALRIARQSRRVMRQNMTWALAYNLIALPIARPVGSHHGWQRSACHSARWSWSATACGWHRHRRTSARHENAHCPLSPAGPFEMNVVFALIGVTVVLLVVIVMVMLWAIRSGQFDDMQGPACSSSDCDKHAQRDATSNSHGPRRHEQAFNNHR
jgi:Cu2+-exporting ATPase